MYLTDNIKFAIVALLVAIAMGMWFATEAFKEGKDHSNARYYTAMSLMVVFVGMACVFAYKSYKNGNAMPIMPSINAGAANVPVPGGPAPTGAPTNAKAANVA